MAGTIGDYPPAAWVVILASLAGACWLAGGALIARMRKDASDDGKPSGGSREGEFREGAFREGSSGNGGSGNGGSGRRGSESFLAAANAIRPPGEKAGTLLALAVAAVALSAAAAVLALRGPDRRLVPVSGVVAAAPWLSGGSSPLMMVPLADGVTYGCAAARCASLAVGDRVALTCQRAWPDGPGDPGWDCIWRR